MSGSKNIYLLDPLWYFLKINLEFRLGNLFYKFVLYIKVFTKAYKLKNISENIIGVANEVIKMYS